MAGCNGSGECGAKQKRFKYASWLPAFAIALLPKCPLCIMAYSGAFSLLGGTVMVENFSLYLLIPLVYVFELRLFGGFAFWDLVQR